MFELAKCKKKMKEYESDLDRELEMLTKSVEPYIMNTNILLTKWRDRCAQITTKTYTDLAIENIRYNLLKDQKSNNFAAILFAYIGDLIGVFLSILQNNKIEYPAFPDSFFSCKDEVEQVKIFIQYCHDNQELVNIEGELGQASYRLFVSLLSLADTLIKTFEKELEESCGKKGEIVDVIRERFASVSKAMTNEEKWNVIYNILAYLAMSWSVAFTEFYLAKTFMHTMMQAYEEVYNKAD